MKIAVPAALALVLGMPAAFAGETGAPSEPPSNEAVFLQLCDEAVQASLRAAGIPDRSALAVMVADDTVSRFFEQEIITSLRAFTGTLAVGRKSGSVLVDCSIGDPLVRYGASFHDGLFGRTLAPRTVSFAFRYTYLDTAGGVLSAGTLRPSKIDTVAVHNLGRLESGSAQFLHGDPPDDTFLDALAEPLVVIAATAVVVYLFFTIRS